MTDNRFLQITEKAILILLAIQISIVSISIALSSIAFGIWLSLWIIQIIYERGLIRNGKIFKELNYVNIFMLIYFFFEIFSRFFAVYPEGAFANLKRLLLFLIFFVSIIKIIDKDTLFKILLLNIIVLSIISLIEIIKYSLKFNELISSMPFSEIRIDYFNYPLTTAEIKMISILSVLPAAFLKDAFFIKRKYIQLLILPVFISMILTQSRNVFLAVFVCFILYGVFINRKFLLMFLLMIAAGWFFLPRDMTERIKSIADVTHPSNETRIAMWDVGLKMFADHPFTGVADSHIKEIYETYKIPDKYGEGVHLHNNFIMILATTGIFGFIGFIGMFISIFIKQIEYYKSANSSLDKMLIFGSILVLVSFHISGIFEWSFGDHEVLTVFLFLISVPFILKNIMMMSENSN